MEHLRDLIIAWAETRPDIRAVLVVGSRARRDPPPDEWADLDLMLFVTDFDAYLSNTDWLDDLGEVWVCLPSQTGDGDPEYLVLLAGGKKVDFVFYPLDELQQMVQTQTIPAVYHRGYNILLDKDDLAKQLPSPPIAPSTLEKPSQDAFSLAVNGFWYGAVYVAKQIRRRNLWVVKFRDWSMKEILLRMIEWHSRAIHGWDYDTWHDGHFLPRWNDSLTLDALGGAFGHFDAADSWRALLATMELFHRLGMETAQELHYDYPTALDERVTRFVQTLRAEDDLRPGTFPTLETKRLVLREFQDSDAQAVFDIFARDEVTRYYNLDTLHSVEQAQRIVSARRDLFARGWGIRWAITLRNGGDIVMGSVGYYQPNKAFRSIEIGYDLHPDLWRQGIMTEALTAAINYGFSDAFFYALNRIEALTYPEHVASIALLRKMGFREEGVRREYGYWKDGFHDLCSFSLLRRDWER